MHKIYCEDTRNTRKLLGLYNIPCPELIRCDEHFEQNMIPHILADIRAGHKVALVSDAGTPLISDPGYGIIHHLRTHNIPIIPVAGACAAVCAMSVSGLPTDKFVFLGFAPKKSMQRLEFLKDYMVYTATYVFYERADRLNPICSDIADLFPDAKIVIGREITKKFEEFISGTPKEILDIIQERDLKGEVVLCVYVDIPKYKTLTSPDINQMINDALAKGTSIKDISADLAQQYGLNKKEIYKLAQSLKDNML